MNGKDKTTIMTRKRIEFVYFLSGKLIVQRFYFSLFLFARKEI